MPIAPYNPNTPRYDVVVLAPDRTDVSLQAFVTALEPALTQRGYQDGTICVVTPDDMAQVQYPIQVPFALWNADFLVVLPANASDTPLQLARRFVEWRATEQGQGINPGDAPFFAACADSAGGDKARSLGVKAPVNLLDNDVTTLILRMEERKRARAAFGAIALARQLMADRLVEHFGTEAERRAWITAAFGTSNLANSINTSGVAPNIFTQSLIATLVQFGTLPDGRPALCALLQAVRSDSGADKQADIDWLLQNYALVAKANSTEPVPFAPLPPPVVATQAIAPATATASNAVTPAGFLQGKKVFIIHTPQTAEVAAEVQSHFANEGCRYSSRPASNCADVREKLETWDVVCVVHQNEEADFPETYYWDADQYRASRPKLPFILLGINPACPETDWFGGSPQVPLVFSVGPRNNVRDRLLNEVNPQLARYVL